MPCFSEVTPVVETTREAGKPVGFKRPAPEYRTDKTIRLFPFWTKEK